MKTLIGYLLLIFCCVVGCTTKTEVYESQLNKEFKNGQTIFLKKTDEVSRVVGSLTGHLWNEHHTFRYQFTIEPDAVEWEGLLGETPQSLLYCDKELFLRTSSHLVLTDTVKQVTRNISKPNYYRHVDKRYFFKMLGDQYFVMIDSLDYQTKNAACGEELAPGI